MIRQLINNSNIGWYHPNTIHLAFDIITEFGKVLENNGWMIYGAPESLLPVSKGDVRISFEALYRFLHNKDAWNDFREKYPEIAKSIISNSFYKALINAIPYIEQFVSDEEVFICVEAAKYVKESDSEKLYDFLRNANQTESFFQVQNKIEQNKKNLFNYLDSQDLLIKDDIFG